MIAINKADGDNRARAQAAAAEYRAALHILGARSPHWSPPVVTYSALTGDGIAPLWAKVLEHHDAMSAAGELAKRRREQQIKWMWAMLEERILARLRSDPALRAKLPRLEAAVADGRMSASLAVEELAAALGL
jgi:LAO/AO transport system kinase